VRLLLDTAILIHSVVAPERLTKRVAAMLEDEANVLEVSAMSISEIAIKAARGKLRLSPETIRQALDDMDIRVLPYTTEHAYVLFDIPLHHGDPFDRQIIAQAMAEEIPVVTSDRVFRLYKNLTVIC
jgi:PIN domain nuclease of toxin-antitoxin system